MPGKEGGRKGGADKQWRDALLLAGKTAADAEFITKGRGVKRQRVMAEVLVQKAIDGDMGALKEYGDRVDGRPAQALEHTGKDGEPLQTHGVLVVPATVSMEEWVEQARRLQKPPE